MPDPTSKPPSLVEVLRAKAAEHAKMRALVAASDPAANLDIDRVAAGFESCYLDMAEIAAPYAALIRQQEARIAELEKERDAQTRAFCAIPMRGLEPEFFLYREWEAEAEIGFFSTAQEASEAADAAMELAREELAQNGMVDDPEIVYGRVYARCEVSKSPAPEHSEHDEVWQFDFEPRLTAELEVVQLRAKVAELEELAEKRREESWAWMQVANERGAELAQCKLDMLCLGESSNAHLERIRILEAEVAPYRELAKRAAELVARLDADGASTFGVVHDLAEMHKEATDG